MGTTLGRPLENFSAALVAGRQINLDRVTAARAKFTGAFAEAITDWRLISLPPRPQQQRERVERELIRAAVAEILAIRLEVAYAPILTTLERIEHRVGVLADLRREPWAPAAHAVNRQMPARQPPPSALPALAPFACGFGGPP